MSGRLRPRVAGGSLRLAYPQPFLLGDWTYRPRFASGGRVLFVVGGAHRVLVRERGSSAFPIPAGHTVTIPADGAHDLHGNTNAKAVKVR